MQWEYCSQVPECSMTNSPGFGKPSQLLSAVSIDNVGGGRGELQILSRETVLFFWDDFPFILSAGEDCNFR